MMKSKYFLGLVCTGLTLLVSSAFASAHPSLVKKRVLADLDCIHSIFAVKYAPASWKGEFAGWDLSQSIQDAKNKIINHPSPSLKDCQVVLRDFFNSTKDYHVGVRFYSTESATLPFLVKGAGGRYFVAYVDREQVSNRAFPFEEGDEILTFDHRPIDEVVQELRIKEYGSNTPETDQALAELTLTQRRGELGHIVPSGKVDISGLKKGDRHPVSVTLSWSYVPEKIRDFSKLSLQTDVYTLFSYEQDSQNLTSLLKKNHFLDKCMVASIWDKSFVGSFSEINKHSLGSKSSFIPALGRKIWKASPDAIFDAYIFETPSGERIGYIRLPHYIGDDEEVDEFGQTMNFFQRRTDALVIDQVNNPGGSVFYLYSLAAILTDKPLYTPQHHIALTQEEVFIANHLLPHLEHIYDDVSARNVLGETIGGYPVDLRFVKLMKQFCHFLIDQWESGKLYSEPTFLFGVNEVQPHPKYRYTKPVLFLINSLDFSGGDFLPAILQDNKRATILGTRTAGAGGYILRTEYPNHSGIHGFVLTGSLAERINHEPIENLGVRPDIPYELSIADLQENYIEYLAAIQDAIALILGKQ